MLFRSPAILLIGSDPTEQHPLLAWNIRTNVRLRRARLYVINEREIKLRRQATAFLQVAAGSWDQAWRFFEKVRDEKDLVIIFGSEMRGDDVANLVRHGSAIPGAKFICLADYANSRGASDMGLYPDLLPGYSSVAHDTRFSAEWRATLPTKPGMDLRQMIAAAAEEIGRASCRERV